MAAPMSFRRGLSRLQTWCRNEGMCRRYAKTKTSAKPKKVIIREPEPWEDRPKGLIILKEHAPFIFKFEDAVNMHKEAAQPAMANNMQGHIYADILEPEPWENRPKGLIILKEHAPFIFKFEDAVNMHKEAAQPAMANNMQGHIYADILEPEPWEDRPKGLIILKEHAPFIFKFEDAVNMHKEAAQPAMANNMQGHIYADILLDFTSNKVTKPMKHYIDCLHFPHKFHHEQEYQFMVFSESEETLDVAKSLNINLCGGMDFIEKFLAGQVHRDDIAMTDYVLATPDIYPKMGKFLAGQVHRDDIAMTDYVLATPDIYPKMAKLRTILKTKFPKPGTDQIGKDLQAMVNRMNTGIKLSTQVNVIDEVSSRVQVPFGQLEQPVDDLAQNFDYLAQHLFNKKASEKLASHIQEVILIAPPSQERFTLNMNYITRKHAEVKGKRAKTEDNKADLEEESDMEDEKNVDKNTDELSDNEDEKR